MSLNKFTDSLVRKEWMKISCAEVDSITGNFITLQTDDLVSVGIESYKQLYSGSGDDIVNNQLSFITEISVKDGLVTRPYIRLFGTHPQSIAAGTTSISEIYPLSVTIDQNKNFTGYARISSLVNQTYYPLLVEVSGTEVRFSGNLNIPVEDLNAILEFNVIVPLEI